MTTADCQVRNTALKAGSCIVQAPAGSGKTELLTQRYLRLLSTVDKPERVLAITFTRKATQEMRERIMLRLGQAAANETTLPDHEQVAVGFAQSVLAKSKKLGWLLEENPGRLQILTIDGLCARISSQSAQPGNGVADLKIVEDAGPLYRIAARQLIEDMGKHGGVPEVFEALTRVLIYLQGNAGTLLEMLSEMLARRDQWLCHLNKPEIDMDRALDWHQQVEMEGLSATLGEPELLSLTSSLAEMARNATDQTTAQPLLSALDQAKAHPADSDPAARAIYRTLKVVATAKNEFFAASSVKSRVLANKDNPQLELIETVKSLLLQWHSSEAARLAFERFVSNPPLALSTDARAVLADFQLLLKYATAELRVLFSERGKADFLYVSEMALTALGDALSPGDALLAEDGRLEHILLDEFQDTSLNQYELISRLVSGWQENDGRTLFLVGDPMQSIYRFRKADVSLFNRVFRTGLLGDVSLQPLQLASNFRAKSELIDWVNHQFPLVFIEPAHFSPDFVAYTEFRAEQGGGGKVVAHPYNVIIEAEGEASLIADLIIDTRKKQQGISIAVLARKRKQLEIIARELQAREVNFEAVQVEDLSRRPVVSDLLMILRAIIHPGDRIAWLGLLRAPWCALEPADLLTVAGSSKNEDILRRIADPQHFPGLDSKLKSRLQALHKTMSDILAARRRMALSRLVEIAWLRLKGPFVVGSGVELENAGLFFKLLEQVERDQPDDLLDALANRMERFYSCSKAADVKLMTIHKAKGLEFDVVILPGLHKGGGRADIPLLRIQELAPGEGGGVMMAPRKRQDQQNPELYGYLGMLDKEREACESRRVLYVATTRAKSQLHLFGGWKWEKKTQKPGCPKGTYMDMLWPFFESQINIKEEPDPERETSRPAPPLLPQLYLRGEPELEFQIKETEYTFEQPELKIPDRDNVALGRALHTWLELIHDHQDQDWSIDWFKGKQQALESSLREAGANSVKLKHLAERLIFMIGNALQGHGQEIINPPGRLLSLAEASFFSRSGFSLVKNTLDLVYLNADGSYCIVDYKTGSTGDEARDSWQKQLSGYRNMVEKCTGSMVSRMQVYHPDHDLSYEIEPGECQ